MGVEPFLVLNGDVWMDYPYAALRERFSAGLPGKDQAHLVLVPNPDHNPRGDFAYDAGRMVEPVPGMAADTAAAALLRVIAALHVLRARRVSPVAVQRLQRWSLQARTAAAHRGRQRARRRGDLPRRLARHRHAGASRRAESHVQCAPMTEFKGIPVVPAGAADGARASGEKYVTPQGFTAIRDGIKAAVARPSRRSDASPPGCARRCRRAAGSTRSSRPCASTAWPRCARKPSAPTSVNAGTPARRPSCSWARSARAPAASARSTPATRAAGSTPRNPPTRPGPCS